MSSTVQTADMSLAATPGFTNLGEFALGQTPGHNRKTYINHNSWCCVLAIIAHLGGLLVGNALLDLVLVSGQKTAAHVDILLTLAIVKLTHQGAVKRQLDRPGGLGHGLDVIEQHFFGEVLIVDDILFQVCENFFSGSADGEGHGVGVSKGIVLAEHPQQTAANLVVGGQLYIYIFVLMSRIFFGGLLIPTSRISW